jgi:hypothetical protein
VRTGDEQVLGASEHIAISKNSHQCCANVCDLTFFVSMCLCGSGIAAKLAMKKQKRN